MICSLKSIFQQGQSEQIPIMDLPAYRALFLNYSKPSLKQIGDFVNFVCHAKSWYKHLPYLPPGEPYHFYLDHYAGWKCMRRFGGKVSFIKHKQEEFRKC